MGLETLKPMAAKRPMRQRVEDARRRAATTPGRLRMLSVAIAAVAIALMLIGTGALVTALVTTTTMQQRTVPDVVGMQHVHAWLSDADRHAASAYLAGDSDASVSQLQFDTESAATNLDLLGRINPDDPQFRYAADIAAASRELQRATDQSGISPETEQRLAAIAQSLGYYTSLVRTAGALEATDTAAGTVYLQAATNLMHGEGGILAQVDALRDTYNTDLSSANLVLLIMAGMLVLYIGVALALLGLLVHTQRYVRARFRRRRNGRLLAATLLVLVVAAGAAVGTVQAAQGIRASEDQSYARLLTLWNVREVLYDANGNQSMSLIALGKGSQFDQAFQAETAQLVDQPLTDQLVDEARNGQVHFHGMLADEMRSASTPPEREAAYHALIAYQKYMQADASVRQQADAAVRAQAAAAARAQAARNNPGAAKPPSPAPTPAPATAPPAPARPSVTDQTLVAAVDELDYYLGASMQILQRQFDESMSAARVTLALTASLEVLAVAVVALVFWGLQPRIDEYR
jgi:hypothetical protein